MAPGHSDGENVQEVAHPGRQEHPMDTWPEYDKAVYHSAVWCKPPGVDGSIWWVSQRVASSSKLCHRVVHLSGWWTCECGRVTEEVRLMFSVPPDAATKVLGSTGGHKFVCGGSGYCSLTIDVSLGQTKLVDV